VLSALEELVDEGIITAVPGSGYFVKATAPDNFSVQAQSPQASSADDKNVKALALTEYAQRVLTLSGSLRENWLNKLPEINFGMIPAELTPQREWERMMRRYCRAPGIETLSPAIEPFGYPPLREAISAYLHRSRAVQCTNTQVAIFSSKQLRLELVCRILINPGDYVAVEEPGYAEAKYVFKSHGARITAIPADENGLIVDELVKSSIAHKIVYVTPSHQDPTGPPLSFERRERLLNWAKNTGAIIIEDDYDSEYRYGAKSLPSLQGLDRADCVVYFATIWKSLQMLGFGIAVFPNRIRKVAELAKMEMERYLPVAEQVALAELINEGHLEKYLKKSQAKLSLRRQELMLALTVHCKDWLSIYEEGAGTHLIVRCKKFDDRSICESACRAGIMLMSTDSYYEGTRPPGEFMLPFAHYQKSEVDARIKQWSAYLKQQGGGQ